MIVDAVDYKALPKIEVISQEHSPAMSTSLAHKHDVLGVNVSGSRLTRHSEPNSFMPILVAASVASVSMKSG